MLLKHGPAYILSTLIAILAILASAGGPLLEDHYRDNAFVTTTWLWNDAVTLFLAASILISAMVFAAGGSLRAQLIWLGALDYRLHPGAVSQQHPGGERWHYPNTRTPLWGTLTVLGLLCGGFFGKWTAWLGLFGFSSMLVFFPIATFAPAQFTLAMLISMFGGLALMDYHVLLARRMVQFTKSGEK